MKKILFLLITLFILVGCTGQQQPIKQDTATPVVQETVQDSHSEDTATTQDKPTAKLPEGFVDDDNDLEKENDDDEDDKVKGIDTQALPAEDTAAASQGKLKEFTMEAYLFGFEPAIIEVNEGDTVRITIKSRDVEHGIGISAFHVNKKFGKEPVTVEFVADKKGEYPFICSVFCGSGHRDMKGTLIVN